MNKSDYAKYEDKVKKFFKDEGIANLTCSSKYSAEPFFSWNTCDCCRTPEGGDRLEANGYNPTTESIQEYIICTDCEYYVEYGRLDDVTMFSVEEED